MIAHTSPGESAIAAVVHATGGLHYLLGLVAAGLATTSQGRRATLPALLGAAVAGGGTLGMLGSGGSPRLLGLLAAVAAGLSLAASTRAPTGFVHSVMIVFACCYGLIQGDHLLSNSHAAGKALAGMLVATAGTYLLGAIASTIADETATRTPVTVALGAATVAAAVIALIAP